MSYQQKLAKLTKNYLTAKELRKFLGLTERQYRKLLSTATNVVESKMCSSQWNDIEFSKVPSLAHSRYKRAFSVNCENYNQYIENQMKYILMMWMRLCHLSRKGYYDCAQLDSLENCIGNKITSYDTSGSMITRYFGLYCADKNLRK